MSDLSDNAVTFIKFYSITSWIYVINRASSYYETNWHMGFVKLVKLIDMWLFKIYHIEIWSFVIRHIINNFP